MPTFKFGFEKSGMLGHATPEQQAVIDRLQAGEITPDEAAKQLGGHAHTFQFLVGRTTPTRATRRTSPSSPRCGRPRRTRGSFRRLHLLLLALTAVLGVPVVFGGATLHEHALTAAFWAFLALLLFGAITARVGLRRTPSGTVLATVPLIGAWIVLDWGLFAAVIRSWSLYFPGLVVIGLAAGVSISFLLLEFAVRKTRATVDDRGRRR